MEEEARETGEHPSSNEEQIDQESFTDDVDAILDEIDEVLDENREEFVRSYVQKGGQGQSFIIGMEVLGQMAAWGIWQGLNYDGFKRLIGIITRRFNSEHLEVDPEHFGEVAPSPIEGDSYYDPEFAADVRRAYKSAERVAKHLELKHTREEEAAFKSFIFMFEMQHLGFLRIGSETYKRLARAAEAMDVSPEHLARRIIDQALTKK